MSLALVVEEVEGNRNEEVSYFGSYFIEKTDLPPKGGENSHLSAFNLQNSELLAVYLQKSQLLAVYL